MPKVHLLPPDIISKIAAGEVIDRPASVIKELIENAIDAESTSIEIELAEAGKTLIKIKDTGTGIAKDDIENIFARHSTSKIKTADDLFNIHSLGFRGEALYSICSIADITVRSKSAGQDSGWEIHMRGGKQLALRPVAMQTGTEIQVKELFFNTPARRKFLRSNMSEMNHILNIIIPFTLLYPDRRFLLRHNDKIILDLPATTDISKRIATTLGLKQDFLINAQRDFPEQQINIHLVIGDINIARAKKDMQFIFVNGRPVENKNISFHLNDIYRLIFPPRRYPFFIASITMPTTDIDVNIHPTKREVKVRDEQQVCSYIRRTCESALMNNTKPKQIFSVENNLPLNERPSIQKMIDSALKDRGHKETELEKTFEESFTSTQRPTEQYSFPAEDQAKNFTPHLFKNKDTSLEEKLKNARFVGSFSNKYLLFESLRNLIVIDQHAVQERIMFEHYVKQMQDSAVEVQNLLTPYLLRVSSQELLTWEAGQERLNTIGFDTTQFDDQTIAIQSYPSLIKNPEDAVRELLASGDVARCDHDTIARRACRASIMSGDSLTKDQIEFQREQLLQCRNPFTCPHGRPTVIEITTDFLDKQFLRT